MKLSQILGQPERDFLGLTEKEKRDVAMNGIEKLVEFKKNLDNEEFEKQFGKGMKLNLGCGKRKLKGFINIDKRKIVKPDMIQDLEWGLPKVKSNSVTGVYTSNTLEHIANLIPLMEEIYRVCKNNAIIEILVPHYKSHHAFDDPTHVRFFTELTFQYFSQEHRRINSVMFDYDFKCDFEVVDITIEDTGMMKVILKAKKEDSNAKRRKDSKKSD